jgi:phosphohistidine phosphatase
MIIYFLRHASAGEPLSNPKKDEKRALDETGVEQCGYVGRALSAMDVQVEIILSSPLKRAAQTASLVGNEMGHEGKLQFEEGLRPTASFQDFRKMLDKYARPDAENSSYSLCRCRGKFTAKNFQEIGSFFFYCPQFQIHAGARTS